MLTACAIVKNEEQVLPGMIESLREHVDEVVVVDTGSTDHTKQILADAERDGLLSWHRSEQFDSNTKLEEFHFGRARNEALAYVREGSWVLSIDADERIERCCRSELDRQLESNGQRVYPILITNHKNRYWFYGPRLLHNTNGLRWQGYIHETPALNPPMNGHLAPELLCLTHDVHKTPADSARRNVVLLRIQSREEGRITYTWMQLAMELIQLGQEMQAIGYLDCYLKSESDDMVARANAYHMLGWLYMKAGLPKAATDCAEKLMPLAPRSRAGYVLAGTGWFKRKCYELAKYYWEMALELEDNDKWSLLINVFSFDEITMVEERLAKVNEILARGDC